MTHSRCGAVYHGRSDSGASRFWDQPTISLVPSPPAGHYCRKGVARERKDHSLTLIVRKCLLAAARFERITCKGDMVVLYCKWCLNSPHYVMDARGMWFRSVGRVWWR